MSLDIHPSTEMTSSHSEAEVVDDEELDLGLCLGGKKSVKPGSGEFCRLLTAEDFHSTVSTSRPVSSPSSSSDSTSTSLGAGNKRTVADSGSPDAEESNNSRSRRLVGWPPVAVHRMINLYNQSKGSVTQDAHCVKKKSIIATENGQDKETGIINKGKKSSPLLIKVKKDGDPIGRKVDVNAHTSYISLSLALEDMFQENPNIELSPQNSKTSMLLDGLEEFVLTYEDRDGDWMLVGDVPWGMFLGTVRRLRIMRRLAANGLG